MLGFLVLAIDGFDTAAMGYIAPTLGRMGIHKQDLGPVLSAALLGLSLGALIAGPVSDRMAQARAGLFVFILWSCSPAPPGANPEHPDAVAISHRPGFGCGNA